MSAGARKIPTNHRTSPKHNASRKTLLSRAITRSACHLRCMHEHCTKLLLLRRGSRLMHHPQQVRDLSTSDSTVADSGQLPHHTHNYRSGRPVVRQPREDVTPRSSSSRRAGDGGGGRANLRRCVRFPQTRINFLPAIISPSSFVLDTVASDTAALSCVPNVESCCRRRLLSVVAAETCCCNDKSQEQWSEARRLFLRSSSWHPQH